jgi:hypothetical protein
VITTNCEALHYITFSILVSLSLSQVQIFSSALRPWTPAIYRNVLPLERPNNKEIFFCIAVFCGGIVINSIHERGPSDELQTSLLPAPKWFRSAWRNTHCSGSIQYFECVFICMRENANIVFQFSNLETDRLWERSGREAVELIVSEQVVMVVVLPMVGCYTRGVQ